MEFEVGSVLTGKVTAITKFGAFVTFAPGKSGLVHISEIANAYVSNIADFLTEGQEVKVKVISIDEAGRLNLSIKQALPPAPPVSRPATYGDSPRPQRGDRGPGTRPNDGRAQPGRRFSSDDRDRPYQPREGGYQSKKSYQATDRPVEKSADMSFEDKLKRFMQDSDSKISGLYADKRPTRRRPK